jgi:hypothetical protein
MTSADFVDLAMWVSGFLFGFAFRGIVIELVKAKP